MSINWVADIADMHRKFGVKEKIAEFDKEKLQKFLEFRINFLQEELDELKDAKNADDIVDALIDLCVVAIGTMDAYNINPFMAWDAVHTANMSKEVGVKASRPNPLGLPDLVKPEGWQSPSHMHNTGLFETLFAAEALPEVVQPVSKVDFEEVPLDDVVIVEVPVLMNEEIEAQEAIDETPDEEEGNK